MQTILFHNLVIQDTDIGCSFKFPIEVGVETSIVNQYGLRITHLLFKSYVFTRMVRSQSTLQRQL
jgi:hypothetical protein